MCRFLDHLRLIGELVQETWQSDTAAWPDAYWSALEFYFWEPQHLNRYSPPSPDKKRGLDEVLSRLRAKEVPLNHLFAIFFSLAPPALSARLVEAVAPGLKGSAARLISSPEFRHSNLCDVCQPDLFLLVDERPVFWELKLDSKTSTEQLLKYALLGELVSREPSPIPVLILVGRTRESRAVDAFWKHLTDASLSIPPNVENHARRENITTDQLLAAAQKMPIYRASYSDVRDRLKAELESINSEVESGQTLCKLLQGMIETLETIK
jgi:hypothetical protein